MKRVKQGRIIVTCARKLTKECIGELSTRCNLYQADCFSDRHQLAKLFAKVQPVDWAIIGGEEYYDETFFAEAGEDAFPQKGFIFAGIQAETSFSPKIWQKVKDRVFATGGGGPAVVRKVIEHVTSFNLTRMQSLISLGLTSGRKWDFVPTNPAELYKHRKITVIGPGNIGSGVLKALDEICEVDLFYTGTSDGMPKKELHQLGFQYVQDIAEAVQGALVVTAHIPETPETVGILDGTLKQVRDECLFLNLARPRIMSTEYLLKTMRFFPRMASIWDTIPLEKDNAFHSPEFMKQLGGRLLFTGHTAADAPDTYEHYSGEVLKIIFGE